MAQSDPLSFVNNLFRSSYTPVATDTDGTLAKPKMGDILRSKRVRIVAVLTVVIFFIAFRFYDPRKSLIDLEHFRSGAGGAAAPASCPPQTPANSNVDWSRYAYVQYVTNTPYLCNSVMLFEILHRLGTKADKLMMYPSNMHPDTSSDSVESKLLLKAQNEYGVKLMPIQVQHRDGGDPTWADSYTKLLAFNQTQYDRVLSLDSDSTVLQLMDELFLLPPTPVAMPRAYWLDKPEQDKIVLSSQLVLIQPSVGEFNRVKNAIDNAKDGDFDMDIVNNLYILDCMIIPHRKYDLLTGEFRSKGTHSSYLGNEYEGWDPEKALKEASFLHFSDWPMPKPWLGVSAEVQSKTQPECENVDGKEDCRARDLWLGFYSDFKERRKNICDIQARKTKREEGAVESIMRPRNAYDFVPESA